MLMLGYLVYLHTAPSMQWWHLELLVLPCVCVCVCWWHVVHSIMLCEWLWGVRWPWTYLEARAVVLAAVWGFCKASTPCCY